jgi:hypothetical protein
MSTDASRRRRGKLGWPMRIAVGVVLTTGAAFATLGLLDPVLDRTSYTVLADGTANGQQWSVLHGDHLLWRDTVLLRSEGSDLGSAAYGDLPLAAGSDSPLVGPLLDGKSWLVGGAAPDGAATVELEIDHWRDGVPSRRIKVPVVAPDGVSGSYYAGVVAEAHPADGWGMHPPDVRIVRALNAAGKPL